MGMSASQARLLQITARMHDIEYKAQSIEDAKISLATQRDDLYSNYCNKLDATKIQIGYKNSSGIGTRYVDANFANVCTYVADRQTDYAITDAKTGKTIVPIDVAEAYEASCGDKYSFAWFMLGFDEDAFYLADSENAGYYPGEYNTEGILVEMTDCEQQAYEAHKEDNSGTLEKAYKKYEEVKQNGSESEIEAALKEFRQVLYSNSACRSEILKNMSGGISENGETSTYDPLYDESSDWDDKLQYYLRLFDQIESSGGCITVDKFTDDGNFGNEWFNNMVNSGRVLLNVYNKTKKEWTETSPATSTTENYVQEMSDDTDLKKAEAEYQFELQKINKKDTEFDKELSKLENERSALKTEMEAVKTVRNDNEERTFGIFG